MPQTPDLPAPLRAAETGTFTHHSVVNRLPAIGRRCVAENQHHFSPAVQAGLLAFLAEIPTGAIVPLPDTEAPDAAAWQTACTPYLGQNWLDIPWFFAETYFYRRILSLTGYFTPGPGLGFDPYQGEKQAGLAAFLPTARSLAEQAQNWPTAGWSAAAFTRLLHTDLWSNQADLSMWPAGAAEKPDHQDIDRAQAHLLADDAPTVAAWLESSSAGEVVFLIDNAGAELVCDLFLAAYLLETGRAQVVEFHLKLHPTFVSDALPADVETTIAALSNDAHPALQAFGERLAAHRQANRLRLSAHPFWTSPHAAWDMPPDLRETLRRATLVISKGDANYRRLLGDRHWPFDTPFHAATQYFPAPLAALRTCKSEIVVGLEPAQIEPLNHSDPAWLTTGRWGVIQFKQ